MVEIDSGIEGISNIRLHKPCNNSVDEFQRIYHRIAHSFEGTATRRGQLYSDFANFFNSGDTVIDLGAGDGTWMHLLRERGIHPIGIDFDTLKVNQLKTEGFEAVESDVVTYVSTLDKSIDGLSMLHIIEHLLPSDALRILYTIRKHLSNTGRVLIVTPNFSNPIVSSKSFWLDITHLRPYPGELLFRILSELGFQTIIKGTSNNQLDTFVCGSLLPQDTTLLGHPTIKN